MNYISRGFVTALIGLCMVGVAPVGYAHHESSELQLAQVDTEKKAKKAKKKKEKRECRRVRETGSRIATRVCKKPSQWARDTSEARESVERSRDGTNRNLGTVSSQ